MRKEALWADLAMAPECEALITVCFMMDSTIVALDSINQNTVSPAISVRVARIWKSINAKNNEAFELNMQLLYDKCTQMLAVVPKKNMKHVADTVKEGEIYQIEGFNVKIIDGEYRPFKGIYKICISEVTEFTKVQTNNLDIPRHKFEFVPYHELPQRNNIRKYLTDIVGVLRGVTDVANVTNKNQNVIRKRELDVEMERDCNVNVTLWGEKTELIDDHVIEQHTKPITIIVTTTTVHIFKDKISLRSTSGTNIHLNLDIPEAEENFKRFPHGGAPIAKMTESRMTLYKPSDQRVNNITLSTALVVVKLEENLDSILSFPATVKEVDTANGWSYLSCTYCKGGVENVDIIYRCKKCRNDVKFPVWRYRIKLIVTDGNTSVPMIAFDDDATCLLKYTAPELTAMAKEENGEEIIQTIFSKLPGYEGIFQIKPT